MVKPVTIPNIFATGGGGNVPVSQIDTDFSTLSTAINDLGTYINYFTDTGSVNAYAVTLTVGLTATLSNGLEFKFRANSTNTGTATLAAFGFAAAPLLRTNGTALQANDISAGTIVDVIYDAGSGSWFVTNMQIPGAAADRFLYTTTNAQSIPNSANTTVTTWTRQFDLLGTNFNATTGTFTAPATGYYQVDGGVEYANGVSVVNAGYEASIVVNAVIQIGGRYSAETTQSTNRSIRVGGLVSMTSGQSLVLNTFQGSGGALALSGTGYKNYISLFRVV